MNARYFAVGAVWAASLVGVGLWAQAPTSDAQTGRRIGGSLASPQVLTRTTGAVAGRVEDSQGGVIPGATVVLISESRGSRSVPSVTNNAGDYVFAQVPPDTYTVEVTMPAFRTLRRAGVVVNRGERVDVPALRMEVATTQQGGYPRMRRPGETLGPIIAGQDIGFQPVFSLNTPNGAVAGRWMVRIDGRWYEASAAMQNVPVR